MLTPADLDTLLLTLLLVPKLQLGNPDGEALGNRSCVALPRQLLPALLYLLHPCSRPASMQVVASRDGKLELPVPNSQAGAWEPANEAFLC